MSAFKLASAVHEPVAGPSHGGTPAATQPALHADVLIKIAQAAGLDTFSKFLRANRDARAALDRPSVWRDVLVAEFGANRALLELLFRVLGRASNAAETSLFVSIRAESGSSLLRVLADQLRMLPVPPAAAHFVAKRLGQLKQAKELRTVQASFSRGASQLPASDARDALLAFAQQLADALPTSSNDGPIFLSILRAAPALPYNITKSHLASFLESTRFPVCPTSVFDSLRIHGTLHALSGSDVVLSLLEVVFQAWRDADQTLLSLLHASGLRIKDFAGSQTKSRYLSPLDAWFASAVKRVIASVSIQVPPSESKISTAEALSSSRLVAFSRFCARQGARLDSRGLSLDLIPAAIEAFASLSPSQRVTEFLVFRAFLADVIPSQSESNECDEIGAELFAAHLKSLPRQQSEPVDLSAATLFFDSGLLDPEIAMDLLKEHAESLIPPAGREAGDSLNVPFLGPRRMDPKVEESFAQMGTLSPRLQNVLALGKPIEKRIGDVAGFGKWLLGRCLEKEDLVGIVTCLKSGVEVGRKEVEIVWGRGVAGQVSSSKTGSGRTTQTDD